jgi:hypothetical protein
LVACSIASVFCALFAFRFRTWRRPGLLSVYFAVFFTLEYFGARYVLPPDVFGLEVAVVCFGLAVLVTIATVLVHRAETGARPEDGA